MNEDSIKTKKSLVRRILGISLKALAGLLIVCILAVAGVLVWLRTESAANFISKTATEQLANLGLELRMGPMGGALPSSLALSDIELSDKHGVFFRASGLHFEARLLSLFKGQLEIADISLDRPEVIRLPELPPSEEPEKEEEPSGGIPALPFGVRIDRIALERGLLHAAVLAPNAKSEAVYTIDLSGLASLEGSSLAAGLKLDFLNSDGTGLVLKLDLDAASGLAGLYAQSKEHESAPVDQAEAKPGEDSLSLSIVMRENQKGLLALLMNDPTLPPYVLSLNGKGPVRDWKADLALLLGNDAPVAEAASGPLPGGERKAEIIALITQLGLACHSGSLWKDMLEKPNFAITLDNALIPGPKAPEALLPVLGERVKASLGLATTETGYGIRLAADSQAWKINLDQAHIGPAGSGGRALDWEDADGNKRTKGLDVSGMLSASITDPAALMKSAQSSGAQPPQPPLPLDSLTLTSSLSALVDGDFSGVEADGKISAGGVGIAMPDNATAGKNQPAKEDFSADYKITARLTGSRVNLDNLNLLGLGITVQAKATADTTTQAVKADAKIVAADNSPWQDLLGRLSGFASKDGEPPFGGYLTLALDVSLPPQPDAGQSAEQSAPSSKQDLPVAGNLRLDAMNMRWPTAQLEKIIGSSISAQAKVSGGQADEPYLLELNELKAGILKAGGQASFLPPSSGHDDANPPDPGTLKAAFTADISDLGPLAAGGEGPPAVSGPLKAEVNADGKLDALQVKLGVSSPAINAGGKAMRDIALRVNAKTSLTDALISAMGDIGLSLGQSPGGPIALNGRWQVKMPQAPAGQPASPMQAAVEDFKMQGAGMELNADVQTTIKQGGFPAIQGTLKGAVKDWNKLAALAGAPLAGGPTDFALNLNHNGRGQEARLNLNLASFRMQEKGSPPSFVIRDVKALVQASGLPDKLSLDLNLDTGRGMAGPLHWQSGKGSVKGSDNNGDFSLVLQAQGASRARAAGAATGKQRGSRGARSSELLALQGAYNLGKMEVLINTFALQQPRQRVGMELKKPLAVRLDKGVAIQGLDMGFQPGGKLTADADMAPGKLNVKLKLEELPFGFFKMFTQATLPDGTLMADVDLQSSGGAPRGNLKIMSRVSATQAVSGVVQNASGNGGSSVFELLVNGNIASSPGPSAVSGAGVRSIPGLIWLTGTGSLGDSAKQNEAREGKLNFQIPLKAGANGVPLPVATAPMAVKLDWNGPIEKLWQAVPMADRYLSGNTRLDVSVSGSMNAPKLLLTAFMAGGSFQDIPNGLLISGINLEARNTPQGDVRALISAKDKQSGNLAIEANLTGVMGKPGSKPALDVRGQLDQFSPLHRDDLSIFLSGIFGVKGPFDAMQVTSDITVTKGELMISSKMGGSVTTLDVVNKRRADQQEEEEVVVSAGPKLDLHIKIPRYFFIRGMGINSEWQGDLRIDGFASAPSLKGKLSPVRGSVDMLSQTFSIEEGEITFTGGMSTNPALDLTLMNEGPNITAYIKVGGSAKKPKLTLESRPPLPHDEVLAMVLFGKRVSELSRFEAIQLANSLRELSGVGGSSLDVLTGVRKSFGLDMLRVGGGSSDTQRGTSGQAGESNLGAPTSGDSNGDSTPTLEAGKYINDSIYVGVEQGITQESTAVRVEVELFPSITLQGKSTSESSEVGIGWKKDY